jgi:hypothetical protein
MSLNSKLSSSSNSSLEIRKYIVKSIRECITKNASLREGEKKLIIDFLIEKFKLYYGRPVSSITEMNQREC